MATTQYIGARYVPLFANPAEWNNTRTYEPLTIVMNEGNSYTSKQYVPKGIDLSNSDYWALTGNYNAQVEAYRKEVVALDTRVTKNANAITKNADAITKNADAITKNANAITKNANAITKNANAIESEISRAKETELNVAIAQSKRFVKTKLSGSIIGHRGAPMCAYENSLQSFKCAKTLMYDVIEVDGRLTSDNIPVCHHDPTVMNVDIATSTWAQLSALTIDSSNTPWFPTAKLAKLEEVLSYCRANNMFACVDVKTTSSVIYELCNKYSDTCCVLLKTLGDAKNLYNNYPNIVCVIVGTNVKPSQEIADIPNIAGVLTQTYNDTYISAAHNYDLLIGVWGTETSTENFGKALVAGVDFTITNDPYYTNLTNINYISGFKGVINHVAWAHPYMKHCLENEILIPFGSYKAYNYEYDVFTMGSSPWHYGKPLSNKDYGCFKVSKLNDTEQISTAKVEFDNTVVHMSIGGKTDKCIFAPKAPFSFTIFLAVKNTSHRSSWDCVEFNKRLVWKNDLTNALISFTDSNRVFTKPMLIKNKQITYLFNESVNSRIGSNAAIYLCDASMKRLSYISINNVSENAQTYTVEDESAVYYGFTFPEISSTNSKTAFPTGGLIEELSNGRLTVTLGNTIVPFHV